PIRAIPVFLAAVLLLGWGADRLYGNARHFSASTVTKHRTDWYAAPDPRSTEPGQCQVQIVARQFHIGELDEMTRVGCAATPGAPKLFVIGDSHALVFGQMLKDYALRTGATIALYSGSCGFIRIQPIAAQCNGFRDGVIADINQGAKPGDVVF